MRRFASVDHIRDQHLTAILKSLDGYTAPHCHEFYEIEYILSGNGTYTIDGVEHRIMPNHFFFMTPQNIHEVNATDVRMYNIMFSADVCDPGLLSQLGRKTPILLTLDSHAANFFGTVFDELIALAGQLHSAGFLLNSVLVKLCQLTECLPNNPSLSIISQAELYIRANIAAPLTLPQVAEHFGFSPSYFSRLFSKQAGQTFHKYVQTLRMDYAKKLLRCTDITIEQICWESGFRDYPNFIRQFRRQEGLCPTEYRKKR